MIQKDLFSKLEMPFHSKAHFEHQIFLDSVATHPNVEIDPNFTASKVLLNKVSEDGIFDEVFLRKIKVWLSVSIFQKRSLALLSEIEDSIQRKIDTVSERNWKIEFINEKLVRLYMIAEKINLIISEYGQFDFNEEIDLIEKAQTHMLSFVPSVQFDLLDDFLEWVNNVVDPLSQFIKSGYESEWRFLKAMKTEFIYFLHLRLLSESVIKCGHSLVYKNQFVLEGVDLITVDGAIKSLVIQNSKYISSNDLRKIKKTKIQSPIPQSFPDLFRKPSHSEAIIKILAEKKYINPETGIWSDEKKANKSLLCTILKNLKVKGYFKNDLVITNDTFVDIAQKSFSLKISIDTMKRATAADFNLSFIPPASELH